MPKLTTRLLLSLLLALCASIMLVACNDNTNYQQGYAAGYRDGRAVSDSTTRTAGFNEGFRAGFDRARPGAPGAEPTGVWRIISIVIAALGVLKIIGSLVLFTVVLVLRGKSPLEQVAKVVATTLAVILVFWITNSLTNGFAESFQDIALDSAGATPGSKTWAGLAAAVFTYVSFWMLEMAAKATRGHAYVETLLVLASSALVTILVPLFISVHDMPSVNAYKFFDYILGVVIGGLAWIVHRLLILAQEEPRRTSP